MASARTIALGSLLAGAAVVIVFAASATSTTGCSTADTEQAPDAALPACSRGPFTFSCDTPAPGQAVCNTSSASSPVLAQFPQNTNYPLGCVINFVGPRDSQGDCRLEAVCKCIIGQVVVDAGSVTPDDGGAEAAAPDPPSTTTGPMWLCDP